MQEFLNIKQAIHWAEAYANGPFVAFIKGTWRTVLIEPRGYHDSWSTWVWSYNCYAEVTCV